MKLLESLLAAVLMSASAAAQVPPPVLPPPMSQTEFVARSGSDTVYFGPDAFMLDLAAQATLAAQARALRANPALQARIEGHSDQRDTRDHALAMGERRASAVREYLIALGVDPTQLTVVSWGKERPALEGRSEMAWALNRRAVTVLLPPPVAPVLPAPVSEPQAAQR